jgi:hypothetical protein
MDIRNAVGLDSEIEHLNNVLNEMNFHHRGAVRHWISSKESMNTLLNHMNEALYVSFTALVFKSMF